MPFVDINTIAPKVKAPTATGTDDSAANTVREFRGPQFQLPSLDKPGQLHVPALNTTPQQPKPAIQGNIPPLGGMPQAPLMQQQAMPPQMNSVPQMAQNIQPTMPETMVRPPANFPPAPMAQQPMNNPMMNQGSGFSPTPLTSNSFKNA